MLAAMPVLNQQKQNTFLSNTVAMAQEYNNYNDDNKYSPYPTEVTNIKVKLVPFYLPIVKLN